MGLCCVAATQPQACVRTAHATFLTFCCQAQDAAYASTALRKGERLLKYCRRGRPHACHVQLSPDECEVEWVSGAAKPRMLRLAAVKDVVAGQTTAVFRSARCSSPPALQELRSAPFEGACQGCISQVCLSPSFIASRTAQSARWTSSARSVQQRRASSVAAALSLTRPVQNEEQQQLWYHGLRASISKFKSMSTGAGATSQLAGVARAASVAQRWKAVRNCSPHMLCFDYAARHPTGADGFASRTQVPSLPRHEGCCHLVAGKLQAACRAR